MSQLCDFITGWSGRYCAILICSQGKHHFQEESQENSGNTIGQDVYEPCDVGTKAFFDRTKRKFLLHF